MTESPPIHTAHIIISLPALIAHSTHDMFLVHAEGCVFAVGVISEKKILGL